MTEILKNDLRRVLCHKKNVIMTITMMIGMVVFAIYFTGKIQVLGNLAIIKHDSRMSGEKEDNTAKLLEHYFHVTYLSDSNQQPLLSELVLGRFDAVITEREEGLQINTVKSDEFKDTLMRAIQHPGTFKPDTNKIRGVGTNITGYLIMIVLLQGILNMEYFAEDKEKHIIQRIASSPVPFTGYLAAHVIYGFCLLFLPAMAVIAAASLIGIPLGFTFFEFSGIMALLCLMAVSFGLFINTISKSADNANMTGSPIVMLTSILGGTFYSFDHSNVIMNGFIHLLPQYNLIAAVNALEQGTSGKENLMQLMYCIIGATVLLAVSGIINSIKYRPHSIVSGVI